MKNLDFEPLVLKKSYELYRQLYKQIEKFPKRSRYTIGARIENNLLELMENITLANIQIETLREPILHKASVKCDICKILFRLSYDLNLMSDRQYIELSSKVNEIGKMLGGWIKFTRNN